MYGLPSVLHTPRQHPIQKYENSVTASAFLHTLPLVAHEFSNFRVESCLRLFRAESSLHISTT